MLVLTDGTAGVPHFFLSVSGPASDEQHTVLSDHLFKLKDSYKPVPIILSLGLSTTLSYSAAIASMDEWLELADASGQNTPLLWVGPAAAGHLKPPAEILATGNNALWHYTRETATEAREREIEVLNMYNMTIQASSWDGSHYGERVALVQAMMVGI